MDYEEVSSHSRRAQCLLLALILAAHTACCSLSFAPRTLLVARYRSQLR